MKKLYRSQNQRIVAGVCGGLGEYFEVDPVVIRLIWIIFIVFGGVGLLAYLLAWIIIPKPVIHDQVENSKINPPSVKEKDSSTGQLFWGILLIVIGILIIANQYFCIGFALHSLIRMFFRYFLPAILIALGIFVILQGTKSNKP